MTEKGIESQGTPLPTPEEAEQFSIKAYKGIDIGLGQADPLIEIAKKLSAEYPGHMILVQQGKFLHGYDKTAYALSTLKNYRLKLVGTTDEPHIRVGFPASNFKRRLWSMVADFGIPYAVSLGNQKAGYTVFVSSQNNYNQTALSCVSDEVVSQVISDLRARGEVNSAAAKQLLSNPDAAGFKLKSQADELDTALLRDLIKLPRDVRSTWGENVRECMSRLMRYVFMYGQEEDKTKALMSISADVDLIKHYLTQAPRLPQLAQAKISFEHRVGVAVELGRLVGGLIKSQRKA